MNLTTFKQFRHQFHSDSMNQTSNHLTTKRTQEMLGISTYFTIFILL